MTADYLALVFLACLGVLQLAALRARLRGLYLIKHPPLDLALALGLIAGAFLWFFLSEPRNLPDTGGGLDGNRQAALSAMGCAAAVVLTLALSSLTGLLDRRVRVREERGLAALRRRSYGSALRQTARRIWTR